MAEQRLIDANFVKTKVKNSRAPKAVKVETLVFLKTAPTIEPETLPIVRQLREELARVTKERDAAVERVQHYAGCWECDVRERGECYMPFLEKDCKDWAWRGPQKEGQAWNG